jgi:hypothetical protein
MRLILLALLLGVPATAFAERPPLDASIDRRPNAAVREQLSRARADAALSRLAKPAHVDQRYGVPSFVWATGSTGAGRPATGSASVAPEQAARAHLTRLASWYRLDAEDVRGARLRDVHDTGGGGIIVSLNQVVDGIEVFRDEVKILMDRDLELLAVSGYLPGRAVAGPADRRAFGLGAPEAIGRALADFAETGATPAVRREGSADGGYEVFAATGKVGKHEVEPIRAKKVLFHLPDELVPAWYVEVIAEEDAASYVVSARDGALLFRHGLMAADTYTYRVWADATGLRAPFDGPQGTATSPHPTGVPDFFAPSFVPPVLVSLQNGPISTNDPWLPPGATQTSGNNVDAYADLAAPDGFSAGDLRGTTTGANVFDHVYDTGVDPDDNDTQKKASATQLFYVNNWLHDWFYDAGFTETAGNAQVSNFGRGGLGGDAIRAESQDYSGNSNADMTTPADGANPRMQMYKYFHSPQPTFTVNQPAAIAGVKPAGTGNFFQQPALTRNVVLPNPNLFAVQSAATVTCGGGPQWVSIAHLDGDLHADLVTANYNTNDVSVIRADGSGGYLPRVDYAMGTGPYTVEARDLNHDGLPDLIGANFVAGTFSVRLGTGGGTFGARTDFTAGAGTAIATVGRFNADAHDDVVTANYYASSVSVFLGNGSGGFGGRVDYPTGTNPNWVAVGDINGDAKADLVTANFGAATISLLLGTGTGTFGPKTDLPVGGSPLTLALGDLDGNGRLDVVTANTSTNTLSVLLASGPGTFGAATDHAVPPSPVTVTLGELNGDGLPDVAVCSDLSNSITYLLGVGNGGLRAPVTQAVGTTPYGVTIGDTNGDGDADLVSANYASNSLTVLRGLVTDVEQFPPFQNAVNGRIVLVDEGHFFYTLDNIMFAAQVTCQAAGVLFKSPDASAGDVPTHFGYSVPFFRVTQADGAAMRTALRRGLVNVTMLNTPAVERQGALDNQIVAHEWGHYLSNRLVGNAAGLTNLQGGGMGEGWSDFVNLLLTVRPEDASLPGPAFGGAYSAGSYAIDSSARPDNAYYFSVRRYPYSTDFTRSPLTFRHIQEGEPMTPGPPIQGSLGGAGNSSVHATGEVWCAMLWECYAELLRATGRLTFAQARDRMRGYLVASLKLTPNAPTLVEARDALLAAAMANDPADRAAFCAAFARRGLGSAALGPGRFAEGNLGVIESFGCGGIQILSATLDPEVQGCDADGVTDVGELGRALVRFRNTGPAMANVSVGVACSSPNVAYPDGSMKAVASLAAGQVDSVSVTYTVTANAGIENVEFTPQSNDPVQGLQAAPPVSAIFNRDDVGTGLANLGDLTAWTNVGWQPGTYAIPPRPEMRSPNALGPREDVLTTPSFVPSTDAVTISVVHFHWYQHTIGPDVYNDGMVVELSTDDGATWTDIGASAVDYGYTGTIASSLNPLAGRPAFVGVPGDLTFRTTTLQPVGSFAGRTCRFRLRSGFDETMGGDAYGAFVRRLEVTLAPGSRLPFPLFGDETGTCSLVAVDPVANPGMLSFRLRGPNPVRGAASFAFDLPRPSPVTLEVFDVRGRRVARLADGVLEAGAHEARWSAPGPAGVYFARLRAMGETRLIRTIVTH